VARNPGDRASFLIAAPLWIHGMSMGLANPPPWVKTGKARSANQGNKLCLACALRGV
jgi:hypothetical protein